jgi:hypothetical protein
MHFGYLEIFGSKLAMENNPSQLRHDVIRMGLSGRAAMT